MKFRFAIVMITILALAFGASAQDSELTLSILGTYETGIFDEGAQEIGAYDASSGRLYVTNADANVIDILDLSSPSEPSLISQISLDDYGDSINSVAVREGLVAAAVEGAEVDSLGMAVFMDFEGNVLNAVEVGVLPDMITFTPDGNYALTANEGEPSDDYSIDPEGSVSIINLTEGVENATVFTASFAEFNEGAPRAGELPEAVRIFGPNATVAQDLEPEYIAVSPDSSTAFVSLQENNALAVIDVATGSVTGIVALGFKDYSVEGNEIDPSNEDGEINIRTVPAFGMYQPDAIATYEVDGEVYIVTANEGDARDYDTYSEEARVADLTLDAEVFPNAEELQAEADLGRLNITTTLGDTDGDGEYEALYSYGARSFTIWNTAGEIVFDSGSEFAMLTSEIAPEAFNSNGTNDGFDGRSDDKGIEPEGVVIGVIGDQTYAFIGLERFGGVMVYNITDPMAPYYVTYANNVNREGNAEEGTAGDQGPEGLVFISAEDSPTGTPLLVVTNEVSGSTTIYEIGQ